MTQRFLIKHLDGLQWRYKRKFLMTVINGILWAAFSVRCAI